MSELPKLIKDVREARNFPDNTCPASRHAQIIGEQLALGMGYPMLTEEPEHCAESILATVAALYRTRTELQGKIEGRPLQRRRVTIPPMAALVQGQELITEWRVMRRTGPRNWIVHFPLVGRAWDATNGVIATWGDIRDCGPIIRLADAPQVTEGCESFTMQYKET